MSKVSDTPRRYAAEFGGAMALYMATLFIREHFAAGAGSPALKAILIASPVLPILLCALAVWRFLRGTDEYMRLLILKALAFSAGATIVVSLSWVFLKDAGAPALPFEAAGMLAMALWAGAAIALKWRDNRANIIATLKRLLLSAAAGGVCAGGYALIAHLTGNPFSSDIALIVGGLAFLVGAVLSMRALGKTCRTACANSGPNEAGARPNWPTS